MTEEILGSFSTDGEGNVKASLALEGASVTVEYNNADNIWRLVQHLPDLMGELLEKSYREVMGDEAADALLAEENAAAS